MRNPLHLVTYYDTYYYCNIVHNILGDPPTFLVTMHSLFEDERTLDFAAPWQKWTALHRFVAQCIHGLFSEDLELYAEDASGFANHMSKRFKNYDIDHLNIQEYLSYGQTANTVTDQNVSYEYLLELNLVGDLEKLVERIADEVFFVMFSNREAMANLNLWIAGYMSRVDMSTPWIRDALSDELKDTFKRDGQLKRQKPPRWVKEAVFYRDRGHCAHCNGDLTHISYIGSDDHYDYIIPLFSGGLNDITNLQLLCSGCNLKKGSKRMPVSRLYE